MEQNKTKSMRILIDVKIFNLQISPPPPLITLHRSICDVYDLSCLLKYFLKKVPVQ